MDFKFWHERWTNNQIGFHQADINPYLQTHWPSLAVPQGQRVFVPLCGKSHDMLWLLEQGYPVMGNEISEIAVQDFFQEHHLTPRQTQQDHFTVWTDGPLQILCGDFFALSTTDMADIAAVYDRASLIAFPETMRRDYAQHLAHLLPADTPMLLITLDYPQQQMQGPPFSVPVAEVTALFQAHFTIQPLLTKDVLSEHQRFKEKGLTELRECIYVLKRI